MQRRPASSDWIGTPNSRHSSAEAFALARLQRISPPRYVQSWQTPKRRCDPLAATVVSTWCKAWCISVRSFASSESTARTRTSNGSRASALLPLFVSRRLTLRLSALDRCRTKYPPASKCLDRLRSGASGGRLKFRKCRRGLGERIGAGEVAEGHPLGRAEVAVIALGVHRPPQQ